MSNYVIGITGKSGSGKTTISKILSSYLENIIVIDVDEIVNDGLLQSDIIDELIKKCKDDVLDKDGNFSKDKFEEKFGKNSFISISKFHKLEKNVHDYINKKLYEIISKSNGVIILEGVLLADNLIWERCDLKILIESDYDKRKEIVMLKDGISKKQFQNRENDAISYDNIDIDYKIFNNYADISTYINKDLEVVLVECMKQKQIIDEKNFLIKLLLSQIEKATLEELREIYYCYFNSETRENVIRVSETPKIKSKIARSAVNSEEAMYFPY